MMTNRVMRKSEKTQIGKYEVLARIAQGGMAEIFLARQPGIGGFSRRVVLKCILPLLSGEDRFVKMFMEEARLASMIHHPNVVQIFDVGEDNGTFYIAMEYIDGLSVGAMVTEPRRQTRILPIPVACEIIAQACAGLNSAHKLKGEDGKPLGIVHRDVSPHNLMVNLDGVVKVVDFGIAKAHDSSVTTRTGNIKGKYAYMSPEQVRGQPLDRRSDIFSLGTVLYELLTGKQLFHRNAELAILVAIIEDPFPTARQSNPDLPEELSNLIDKSLQRNRDDRFASIAEFGSEVRKLCAKLGYYTSPEILSEYLNQECGEQLEKRMVEQLGLGATPVSEETAIPSEISVSKDSEAPAVPDIIDLPPPRAPKSTDRERARLEAKRAGDDTSWMDEPTIEPMDPVIEEIKSPENPLGEPIFQENPKGDFVEASTGIRPGIKITAPPIRKSFDEEFIDADTEIRIMDGEKASPDTDLNEPTMDLGPKDLDQFEDEDALKETIPKPVVLPKEFKDKVEQIKSARGQTVGKPPPQPPPDQQEKKGGWVEIASDSALPQSEQRNESPEESRLSDLPTSQLQKIAPPDSEVEKKVTELEPHPKNLKRAEKDAELGEVPKAQEKSPAPPSSSKAQEQKPKSKLPLFAGISVGIVAVLLVAGYFAVDHFQNARPSGEPMYYAHPPSYSKATIVKEFRPLADYIEKKLNRPVEITTTKNYEELADSLIKGDIHFANLPPLLYLEAKNRDPGIEALVVHSFGDVQTSQSYFIARAESHILSIDQLKGRIFCYPDRRSTTGYLLPRAFLREKGLDPDTFFRESHFSGSHVKVMEDVSSGRCDAGAVIDNAFQNAHELNVKSSHISLVRAAGETYRDVVCASPKLSSSHTESLRKALLRFDAHQDIGRSELSRLFPIDSFVKVRQESIAPIEKAARAEKIIN